jgi:hypothetical protein
MFVITSLSMKALFVLPSTVCFCPTPWAHFTNYADEMNYGSYDSQYYKLRRLLKRGLEYMTDRC